MGSVILEARGVLQLSQFWPTGRSDADTTKVVLDVAEESIRYQSEAGGPFRPTSVFNDAVVKGRGRTKVIRAGKLTVRLQGIDAPELHYKPSALSRSEKEGLTDKQIEAFRKVSRDYRQFLGATATKALRDFLAAHGESVRCRAVTVVDEPNDVFDTYGRFVGDVEIGDEANSLNLCQWLVQEGWAFTAFYSSMSRSEIVALMERSRDAQAKKRGVWKYLSGKIAPFDFDLLEPKANDLTVLEEDSGPVLFPKLYRRQTNWAARRKAKTTRRTFQAYLATAQNGRPDSCYETEDYLENGEHSATVRGFDEFIKGGAKVLFKPHELVFREAASTLLDANGEKILSFEG